MSSINLEDANNSDATSDITVGYNFYSTVIGNYGMVNLNLDPKYIEITQYNYLDKFPHVTHNLFGGLPKSFMIKSIRIYKAHHNLGVGELVLQCRSGTQHTYIVIPLSETSSNGRNNELDDLIQTATGISNVQYPSRLHLNDLIPVSEGPYLMGTNFVSASYSTSASLFGETSSSPSMVVVFGIAIPISPVSTSTISGFSTINTTSPDTVTAKVLVIPPSSSASSDEIYVDCTPEEPNEVIKTKKYFRLSEKDIADICIAILATLFWATAWAIINEYQKNSDSPIEIFASISKLMHREIKTGLGFTFGGVGILSITITMLILFFYAFIARKVIFFKVALYLMTAVFDLWFCSRLEIFIIKKTESSNTVSTSD